MYTEKITYHSIKRKSYMNTNLNPSKIAHFVKSAKMYTHENISIDSIIATEVNIRFMPTAIFTCGAVLQAGGDL